MSAWLQKWGAWASILGVAVTAIVNAVLFLTPLEPFVGTIEVNLDRELGWSTKEGAIQLDELAPSDPAGRVLLIRNGHFRKDAVGVFTRRGGAEVKDMLAGKRQSRTRVIAESNLSRKAGVDLVVDGLLLPSKSETWMTFLASPSQGVGHNGRLSVVADREVGRLHVYSAGEVWFGALLILLPSLFFGLAVFLREIWFTAKEETPSVIVHP